MLANRISLSYKISNAPVDNAMPLSVLKKEIAAKAERQDLNYFYIREPAFNELCGDYDAIATAKILYELNLLKCRADRFTYRAKDKLFGESRPEVYAIKKTMVEIV